MPGAALAALDQGQGRVGHVGAEARIRDLVARRVDTIAQAETADDLVRLTRRAVWVVDPLDGTREFVAGIPEWCVSVGYVEEGRAVAGGICNPVTGETILG